MPEGTAWLTEETQTLSYSEDVTEYLAADGDLLQRMLDTQPFFAEIARNTLPINHTNHIDIQEWWGHVDSFSNAKQISREAVSDFVSVQKATPSVDFVVRNHNFSTYQSTSFRCYQLRRLICQTSVDFTCLV